jgi:asparagine synthase (glutamine-hydrolysing)
MCGIAGYAGPAQIDGGRVRACLESMQHRGPDHQAACRWTTPAARRVELLHARLNIIDLSARANQPLRVGTKWIAFNGELYNYLELRAELESCGCRFESDSDTEVLLRAIEARGWDVLDRMEGMWAFAVYDEADGSLTLCRDRFGEKPLYLFRHDGGLYFGSEPKCLAALSGVRPRVNLSHLQRYMVNGYKALYKTRETFFEGIVELEPGTRLRIESDGVESLHRYWQPQLAVDDTMSYAAAVDGVRDRLIRSVQLRLRSDVPLAFCMSGGVDSNALISIAKRVFGYDVHGFTIANTDARYEEAEMVAHAVGELGIRHTSVTADRAGFLARLRTLIRHHDAPVLTISYYVHWLLMQCIAHHGYRISVSGTGADELLTGYFDHHLAYLYEIRDDADLHRQRLASWATTVKPVVRNPYLSDPDLFIANPEFRGHIFLNADQFSDYMVSGWSEPFEERRFTGRLLRDRMLNELVAESVPVILHEDDLNAMYYSIENRSPFLDRELFDFCQSIPTRHLMRDGMAKAVLRDALAGIAPQRILENPRKVGFNAPILDLLDLDDPGMRAALLDDSPIFEHVRKEKIETLLGKRSLANSESKFLFYFLNAKMFLEEFAA